MPTELNFDYNKWIDYYEEYELNANGVPLGLGDPIGKEYNFHITIRAVSGANDGTVGPQVAASTGIDPYDENSGTGFENQIFVPEMFNNFDITIDQLEGEINLPYIFERQIGVTSVEEIEMDVMGWNPVTRIRVPHSLLGGFTQFRINYQYIYYPEDAYQVLDIGQTTGGFVTNNSIETTRTIVPRKTFVAPPPEPIPPSVDPDQVREILADKIYEKFFNSNVIRGGVSDIKSIQTTTSTDGVNYGVGRETDDDQLIFFKKDRNTPENKADFEGDGSDGIQQIINDLLANRLEDGASGLQDISNNLNTWTTIVDEVGATRISSLDLDPPQEQLNPDGTGTGQPLFYQEEINYNLLYTPVSDINISVPFAQQYRFFQQYEGDLKQQIPNPNGTGTIDRPDEWANQLNISQLTVAKPGVKIERNKAIANLDTNIFELLPNQNQRQNEINSFFQRFNQLIGPKPLFTDEDANGIVETIQDADNQLVARISSEQGSVDPRAYITRTDEDANEFNTGKTLESMRDTLNEYLGDVDTVVEEINEQRPEYENKSEGFLKIRRLNQSILIKSPIEESSFEGWEQNGFTVTMWVRFLNTVGGGSLFTYGNPFLKNSSSFRLETLTKKKGSTLMYGGEEYTTTIDKRVIRLVVWEDASNEDGWLDAIDNTMMLNWTNLDSSIQERRMGYMYDSSVPFDVPEIFKDTWENDVTPAPNGFPKLPTWFAQTTADQIRNFNSARSPKEENFFQYTDIPTDNLDEWFFICATYNPNVREVRSWPRTIMPASWPYSISIPYGGRSNSPSGNDWLGGSNNIPDWHSIDSRQDENFWLNHLDLAGDGAIVAANNYGNRCKVEVISRSDLLRARGYRV